MSDSLPTNSTFDISAKKQPSGLCNVVNALILMPLPSLRHAFIGAGLIMGVWTPLARAQDVTPETAPAPKNAPATTTIATAPVAQRKPPALTAEQKRQQTEEKLRALMINLGIKAAPAQDAILDYLAQDETSRAALRDAEKRLLNGLRRDVPPERMRDLLDEYRGAVDKEQSSRAASQRTLDVRIGYSLDPKIEAVLWLMGVLGEGASKLPTSALAVRAIEAPAAVQPTPPVYGPPFIPNFGARGEIVGTVTAKGIGEKSDYWLEIRDDSGASERYSALWRDDLKTLDPDMEELLEQTPLNTRVRVQWVWQERRRALQLKPETTTQETEN